MDKFEYFSLFTNYSCNFDCSYCSLNFVTNNKRLLPKEKPISPSEFLQLNKIKAKLPELILYVCGGEPLIYPEIEYLLYHLDFKPIIAVSNLSIPLGSCFNDLLKLKGKVRFIGSYHPEFIDNEIFLENAKILKRENMLEYICGVEGHITEDIKAIFTENELNIVIYPYSGIKNNIISPQYMENHAKGWIAKEPPKTVWCKSTKFLIDPYGNVWNCSSHMYRKNMKYCFGNIRSGFVLEPIYYKCDDYRYCNPCQGNYHQYKEIKKKASFHFRKMKYYLVFNGLGAGNIGDESMMQGFLSLFPLPDDTAIEVWDIHSHALKQFPSRYKYIHYQDEDAFKKLCKNADAVLLVGDTPVMEKWGLEWPLRHLSSKLEFCHENKISSYATGVGIDFLEKEEARELFLKSFLPMKAWTVRSVRSRKNLIELGVDPSCISVAADLAWLMPLENINKQWAEGFLFSLGVRKDKPLIGVNVVNEIWKDNRAIKEELAKALDYLIESSGWQVAFFCNEVREGEYFDKEASIEVASMTKNRVVIVPNKYFTPQEMVSFLSCCRMTLSWRYHFMLFSYLAGTVSVSVLRGEKIKELMEDTNGEHIGEPEQISAERIIEKLEYAQKNIEEIKVFQDMMVEIMKHRSRLNIKFLR